VLLEPVVVKRGVLARKPPTIHEKYTPWRNPKNPKFSLKTVKLYPFTYEKVAKFRNTPCDD
jgi:hypothetical protein